MKQSYILIIILTVLVGGIAATYAAVTEIHPEKVTCANQRVVTFGWTHKQRSLAELAAIIRLDLAAAERAKLREYSETLLLEGDAEEIKRAQHLVEGAGLTFTAGSRFHTVTASSDKGKAVNILADIFREERGEIITVGLGDSLNDVPMLKSVDIPILVQRPGGIWKEIAVPRLQRVRGIGPEGWAKAVREVIPGLTART